MTGEERLRLLVVDDEQVVRTALDRWFSSRGFSVVLAEHGGEALELFQDGVFDAVILDIEMPTMNGVDALAGIRKRDPHVPVLIWTGYCSADIESLAGASAVLSKPLSLVVLEDHVRDQIRKKLRTAPPKSD